ncbi:MAG: endolytic transglycosylase MltG [Oscillospiraceae bacterium]|nr:endolytic transglycosylase MltG [Oscillospiraceae bacterium]
MPANSMPQNRPGTGRPKPSGGLPPRRPARPPAPPPQGRRQGRPPLKSDEEQSRLRPKRVGSNWFMAIIMVMMTLGACFFLAMFILQSASDLFGLNQNDSEIVVVVPENSTISSISALLYDKGVVSQPFTFGVYAGLKANDDEILAGNYIFNSNDSYDQIILALKTGITKREQVTVTLIEGWTVYEIAMKLEENGVCSADELIDYLNHGDISYDFVKAIPRSPLRFQRLEGYMFPDTYDFYVGMEVEFVADRFFRNFNRRITSDMYEKMEELEMTLDEVITLASIIQKEADTNIENKTVAQVFYNRLRSPDFPLLQSDVTIHYVERFIKPFLERDNQAMFDAYNTYIREGLPIGPVCNPSLDAINAVLNPDGTGFYYFVTDDAGTYYYATNYQQHLNNITRAEAVGGENVHGTNTVRE